MAEKKTAIIAIIFIAGIKGSFAPMPGDVNTNGRIDLKDCQMIEEHILGIIRLDRQQIKIADINEDGIIDIVDYTTIRLIVLGELK